MSGSAHPDKGVSWVGRGREWGEKAEGETHP